MMAETVNPATIESYRERWATAVAAYNDVHARYVDACAKAAAPGVDQSYWLAEATRLYDMATRYYEKARTAEADYAAVQLDFDPF